MTQPKNTLTVVRVLYESQIRGSTAIGRALGCTRATAIRYLRDGFRGLRLDGVLVGGVWVSSEEAVERFATENTTRGETERQAARDAPTLRQQQRRHDEALERLRATGWA